MGEIFRKIMFIHYRTQGLILKKEDLGEADRLFTIYSRDFGRLKILGKGIRKISSKLRSGMEIFYLSEIEFIQGKTYKTLTDAILIEKFENLRKDLKRLSIAYKISEVLDNLIKGQERDEKIWHLLNEVFNKLNNLQFRVYSLQLIYYYFLWNFLSFLGYKSELYLCSICQKNLKPENLYFNQEEGGVICQKCFERINSGEKIKPETVKILRLFFEKNFDFLTKLKFENEILKPVKSITENYLNYILEKIYAAKNF